MAKKNHTRKTKSKSQEKPREQQPTSEDIVELILADHEPLKDLIEIMKDSEAELEEKQIAYEEFVPLLKVHAKAEEQALYTVLKDDEKQREHGFEGDVEHSLADLVAKMAKDADDEDVFCAQVKVLAELVEHHIEEEEQEVFPEFKKKSSAKERQSIGQEYIELKEQLDQENFEDQDDETELDEKSSKKSKEIHVY